SFAEPGSPDKTARTPPTGRAFMPRMSSMSGPGQKLPRASISLSMVISVSSGIVVTPYLNEQGHLSLFGTLYESGDSGYFGNDGFQVFEFQVKEFHRHAASIDFDIPNLHSALEGLHPGGNFLRHHLLHHDRGIIFEILADAHVGFVGILAECFQTPERDEQLDIHAHCSPTSGERGHGHQF